MPVPPNKSVPMEEIMKVMSREEALQALREHEYGRLAYTANERAHIVPVNYVADGNCLFFRTAAGGKLEGIIGKAQVAFEIDDFSDEHAMSVIVEGRARVADAQEALVVEQLPLRPWLPTEKQHVVCIEIETISGRSFDLSRPWLKLRTMMR